MWNSLTNYNFLKFILKISKPFFLLFHSSQNSSLPKQKQRKIPLLFSKLNTRISKMVQSKDTTIKLFGKTIPLSPTTHKNQIFPLDVDGGSGGGYGGDDGGDGKNRNLDVTIHEHESKVSLRDDQQIDHEEEENFQDVTENHENIIGESERSSSGYPKTPSADKETSFAEKQDQSETSSSQEKTLKKPDTILSCPRCNSLETKFCYYNNYNVKQPRHFCKKCQRYWTDGGTMRNVPVGAGRRKNKSLSSHNRHVIVSEALRVAQVNATYDGSTLITFGATTSPNLTPTCETVASRLNSSEKTQNGFRPDSRIFGNDHLCGPNSPDESRLPFWPYNPWINPMMPPPNVGPPTYPLTFYNAPTYGGCNVTSSWTVPYVTSPRPNPTFDSLNSNLGKHPRTENNVTKGLNGHLNNDDNNKCTSETSVLVPKTLRIDNPNEAAMSSLWTALGIKSEKTSAVHGGGGGGLFRGFKSTKENDDKRYCIEKSLAMQANPAALSRSFNFHEST